MLPLSTVSQSAMELMDIYDSQYFHTVETYNTIIPINTDTRQRSLNQGIVKLEGRVEVTSEMGLRFGGNISLMTHQGAPSSPCGSLRGKRGQKEMKGGFGG